MAATVAVVACGKGDKSDEGVAEDKAAATDAIGRTSAVSGATGAYAGSTLTDETYANIWAKVYAVGARDAYQSQVKKIYDAHQITGAEFDAYGKWLVENPRRAKAIVVRRSGSDWKAAAVLSFARAHALVDNKCMEVFNSKMGRHADSSASAEEMRQIVVDTFVTCGVTDVASMLSGSLKGRSAERPPALGK